MAAAMTAKACHHCDVAALGSLAAATRQPFSGDRIIRGPRNACAQPHSPNRSVSRGSHVPKGAIGKGPAKARRP